jgi:DinB superfamily
MKTLWDDTANAEVVRRLHALSPGSQRRWGKMNVAHMLAHISDQIRMGLGDIACGPPSGILSFPPMNYLAIYVLPWPHGAKGPREAFTTTPASWDSDLGQLLALIDRLRQNKQQQVWPAHPLFGKLSGKDWAALSYKHLSHHLRQFGV